MAATRLRGVALTLVIGLVAVVVTACGGDETPSADPASSPAPTSSPDATTSRPAPEPSPTQTLSPEPPRAPQPPAAADTQAGRKAFALHVVDAWGYALGTNNARPLVQLSPGKQPCDGCSQLQEALAEREAEGWYVDFPGAEVTANTVEAQGSTAVSEMDIVIPKSDSYNEDGSFRGANPAHPKSSFDVQMRFTRDGFELLAFRVREDRG